MIRAGASAKQYHTGFKKKKLGYNPANQKSQTNNILAKTSFHPRTRTRTMPHFPSFYSHRYEQLAPPPHDENPTYKQPNASNDIDIPRELIGREDLRTQ